MNFHATLTFCNHGNPRRLYGPKEYGEARVLDAHRPKLGQDLQPDAGQTHEHHGALGIATALATAAVLAALN